jgi:hypothetical protein
MFLLLKQVRSGKLVSDIGFKIKVTIDDILETLKVWKRSKTPFEARYCSIAFTKLDLRHLLTES